MDITKPWTLNSQYDNNGKEIWRHFIMMESNNDKCFDNYFDKINKKFNIFISKNTIHYAAKSRESWNTLIEEITNRAHQGSIFIINFLDMDQLDKFLRKDSKNIISNNISYVRYINQTEHNIVDKEVSDYWIKIYYDWCHKKPLMEPVLSKDIISKSFGKMGWKIKEYMKSDLNLDLNLEIGDYWDCYQNCFSKLVLEF